MAWEMRGNRSYYYRKVRFGGRVRSEYIGVGMLAEAHAALDEIGRESAAAGRVAWAATVQAERDAERALNESAEVAETLTAAVLIAAGYHTHRRQWRRQR